MAKLAIKSPDQYYDWPVRHGATTVVNGATLMPGVTAETDDGVLIVASGAAADTIAILKEELNSSTTDTNLNGSVWNLRQCELIVPAYLIEYKYDTSDIVDVGSTSTTTVTISSLENNIDSGFLYATTGTGVGGLYYIVTSASGSCTTTSATGWDSTTDVIKILPLFHQLAKLNTAADKLGTDAGAGSWTILNLQNYIQRGGAKEILDPSKHDELTGLSNDSALGFYSHISVRNSGVYTTE